MDNQLSRIKALMKANQGDQARQQLEQYLNDNPEDARGWYLASFLKPTQGARLKTIQRAAKLAPNQPDIQKRLTKLESGGAENGKPSRVAIFVGVLLTLVALSVITVVVLNTRTERAPNEMPTLAVLDAEIDMAVPLVTQTKIPGEPTAGITVSAPTLPVVLAATEIPSEVPSQPFVATETIDQLQPTATIQGFNSAPVASIPLMTITLPPASSDIHPTAAPTSLIAATLTSPAPTGNSPTGTPVTGGNGVALNTAVNIAEGEFRVVDATRNAESLIQELGGTFPPASPNQSWMLLELLLVCRNGVTCAIDPSTLRVVSASGTVYSYSPQLNLAPIFGTISENNQLWGYLGFVVPTNETGLDLTFTQNNQTYTFELQ